MEELKIGEYGRTNLGNIIKFAWIEEEPGVRAKNKVVLIDLMKKTANCFYYFKKNEFIKSHSKRIKDLVEEGDFVNGYICKRLPNFGNEICNFDLNTMEWTPLENIDVWYDIVTHEQFNQMKYIVGDESNE